MPPNLVMKYGTRHQKIPVAGDIMKRKLRCLPPQELRNLTRLPAEYRPAARDGPLCGGKHQLVRLGLPSETGDAREVSRDRLLACSQAHRNRSSHVVTGYRMFKERHPLHAR